MRVVVVRAREDVVAARAVRDVLGSDVLVGPPALDDLAVAFVVRAEREHLHPVGAGLERAHHAGRDAHRVELRELDDLVVELDAAGPRITT